MFDFSTAERPRQKHKDEPRLSAHAGSHARFDVQRKSGQPLYLQNQPVFQLRREPAHQALPEMSSKLTIGQPGDGYEREADRIANQVMQVSDAQLTRSNGGGGSLKREARLNSRKRLQAKRVEANDALETVAPPIVRDVVGSSGQPLDASARGFMEARFGQDFSQVRVHTDARADESARELNAVAYTVGRHIVLGRGRYEPASTEGRRLLAHELTHVVQQRNAEAPAVVAREERRNQASTANLAAAQVTNFGFRGLQRQTVKSASTQTAKTEPTLLAQALLALKQNTLALNDAEKWAVLASHAKYLPKNYSTYIYLYFRSKIKADLISFENITEHQRQVFGVIGASQKEELRKAALLNSKLFRVVTKMQLKPDASVWRIAEMTTTRLSRTAVSYPDPSALAWDFIFGSLVVDVLIKEVTGAPTLNEPLAKLVRQLKKTHKADSGRQALLDKTLSLACGLGNVFALAASRGSTQSAKGGTKNAEPTKDAAMKWLKKNILDLPPDKALVRVSGGQFVLQTDPLLTDLSCTGQKPKYAREAKPLPLTNADSPALFQKSLEKSGGQLNTRLGIVQGMGKSGHMYIVYKDMDGVWYTMDVYVNLADWPGGGLPRSDQYANVKLWHKLIVD